MLREAVCQRLPGKLYPFSAAENPSDGFKFAAKRRADEFVGMVILFQLVERHENFVDYVVTERI